MPITSINRNFEENPNLVLIVSTDTEATVTNAGYLATQHDNIVRLNKGEFNWLDSDFVIMNCEVNKIVTFTLVNATTNPDLVVWFAGAPSLPTFGQAASKNVTNNLLPNVVSIFGAPVVAGNIAKFNDVNGTIADGGVLGQSAAKSVSDNVQPSVSSVFGATVVNNLASFNDITGTVKNSGIPTSNVLQSNIINPDPAANIVTFSVTATAADMALLGTKILYTATSPTAQYRILELYIDDSPVDFAGGGGDRDVIVTDLVTLFADIPAVSAQNLVNARWGSVDLTFPALPAVISTLTAGGANLVAEYFGGTTDYAAGQVTITGVLQKVVP